MAWVGLAYVPMCYILFAQTAKRCHDVDKSGWYQLIPLYFFLLFFEKGDKEANQYGESPEAMDTLVVQPVPVEDK